MPGPWGLQWQQFAMPPVSDYAGNGNPKMKVAIEGGDETKLPGFSVYNKDRRFIDLYNTGNGVVCWSSDVSADWIHLSESSGLFNDEERIWVTIEWDKAPKGRDEDGLVTFNWSSSNSDVWMSYEEMPEAEKKEYAEGAIISKGPGSVFSAELTVFNPPAPSVESVTGFVESNGYISIEAEHYSGKIDKPHASWNIIDGLGRTGSSVTVLPTNIDSIVSVVQSSFCKFE